MNKQKIKKMKWDKIGKDTGKTLLVVLAGGGACFFLEKTGGGSQYASVMVGMLVILTVIAVSWITSGYLYSVLASFIATFAINDFFTYPYYDVDFTFFGYFLSLAILLMVSLLVGRVAKKQRKQEQLRQEMCQEKLHANLLRAVSHDLRTPLSSIVGSISTILESNGRISRDAERKLLQGIKEDTEWLIRLVENLLSITRLQAGQTKIQKRPEMVEEVLAEAVHKFKKYFPGQRVSVRVPEEMVLVPMDALLIEQVIINLLENVVRHSGGSEVIELTALVETIEKSGKEEDTRVCFRVRDYGVGVSKKLFLAFRNDTFYEKVQQERKDGMGIGLSACRSIIMAHGGRTFLKNPIGGGALFGFWLPGAQVEEFPEEDEKYCG